MINYNSNSITKISYNNHDIKYAYGCNGLVWSGDTEPQPHDYSKDTLSFTAKEDVFFGFHYAYVPTDLWFSINNGRTWIKLDNQNVELTPTVRAGEKILWKGTLYPHQSPGEEEGIGRFVSFNSNHEFGKGRFDIEGNAMSLMYSDNFSGQTSLSGNSNAFRCLFSGNTGLEEAENFILPATTLSDSCYTHMFAGCTSLSSAPVLPASTLTTNCYHGIFYSCTSLNKITCLATDISAIGCTTNWVKGVAATGTFTKAASMTGWTTGTNGIPSGWQVL